MENTDHRLNIMRNYLLDGSEKLFSNRRATFEQYAKVIGWVPFFYAKKCKVLIINSKVVFTSVHGVDMNTLQFG